MWERIVSRILLLPVVAGISYELIRFAGRSDSVIAKVVSYPGKKLQLLTTREPDDSMIEVAVKSLEAAIELETTTAEENLSEKQQKTIDDLNMKVSV